MRPLGIEYFRSLCCCYHSITSPQTAVIPTAPCSRFAWNRVNALTWCIIYTSERMFKNTHMRERTQHLQKIIFLSHGETVKSKMECSVRSYTHFVPLLLHLSPQRRLWFISPSCVRTLTGEKWTWAALSVILRVEVIPEDCSPHPDSFCCCNFPNGLILNYKFPNIHYIYIHNTLSKEE